MGPSYWPFGKGEHRGIYQINSLKAEETRTDQGIFDGIKILSRKSPPPLFSKEGKVEQ